MVFKNIFLVTIFFQCASIGAVDVFYAINSGNKKMVRDWVVASENINQVNQDGQSALVVAVINGKFDLVDEILKSKIDLNIVDNQGKTALDWASDYGNYKIIRHLIVVGCKAAQQNSIDDIKAFFAKRFIKSRLFIALGLTLALPFIFFAGAIGSAFFYALFALYLPGICLFHYGQDEVDFYRFSREYFYVRLALNNKQDSACIQSV